jgi:putative transcriptional regulator
MSSNVKFKSNAFEAIHASASALHKVGGMDTATMRSFDETCLSAPPELKPEQINQLR